MTINEKLQSFSEKEIRMLLCLIEAKYETTLTEKMQDWLPVLEEITNRHDNGETTYMESVIETIDLYSDAFLDIVVEELPVLNQMPSKEELEAYLALRKEYAEAMTKANRPDAKYWNEECEWVAEYINEKFN